METVLSVTISAAVIMLLVTAIFFVPWADRLRVRRTVERLGGTVVSVDRVTPSLPRRSLSEGSTTFWMVCYKAKTGEHRVAHCVATCLRCYIDKDEADPE
jgi:hypothetical protein